MDVREKVKQIIEGVRENGFSHTLPGNYLWLSRGDELIEEQNWFLKQLTEEEIIEYSAIEFDPNEVYLTCGSWYEIAHPDNYTILQFFQI